MNFEVLIMGSDANAYYMARCCHEAYNKKAYVIGRSPMAFTEYSNILNVSYDENIWTEDGFLNALDNFYSEHSDSKILLVSSNETYAEFISKNQDYLKDKFVFNYPSVYIIRSLIMKDNFYKTYQDSNLNFPKTYYYECSTPHKIDYEFTYPVILKPSNVIKYNHINFEGKNKIYKLETKEELDNIVYKIENNGYDDTLIIQEFIPGDDSYLFDAVVYCGKDKEVKLVSFAQIGLQEHMNRMVGNAAVLINGYNSYDGNSKEMINDIKTFMEEIGYQGFAEFDMKYDYRDKKFKVLEINARQGRCSYYIDGCGYNLIKILVDDLIFDKKMKFKIIDDEVVLSFVPKKVMKKYVVNKDFREKAISMWNSVINPLVYKKDKNFKRKIFLMRKYFRYYKEYKDGYWK